MTRPTNFYPDRPRYEHFMRIPSNLQNFAPNVKEADTGRKHPLEDTVIRTELQKMDLDVYSFYLCAHQRWMDEVARIDNVLHEQALTRRAVKNYKETILEPNPEISYQKKLVVPGYTMGGSKMPLEIKVEMHKKLGVKPELSRKPFQVEKREAKRNAKNMETKVQVNVWKARAAISASKTVEKITSTLSEVEKLNSAKPLRKAEAVACAHMVKQSKAIRKVSTDDVTNVDIAGGWKVVTNKRNTRPLQNVASVLTNKETGRRDLVCDNSLSQSLAHAVLRAPTNTGGS